MSSHKPMSIFSDNLSHAWGGVFLRAMEAPGGVLPPVIVSLDCANGVPKEDDRIKDALDKQLMESGNPPCSVSSMLIFPFDLWMSKGRPPCKEFSKFCVERFYPRLRKLDRRNWYGTYFQRMMRFSGVRQNKLRYVDQLEMVIRLLKKKRKSRESALQLSCFDPAKDLTGQPVRGFPCLQQVSIQYGDEGAFGVTGYYPTQYIFERAYGNYHGLCNLGAFISHETGLKFSRMTCVTLAPELGDQPKRSLKKLQEVVESRMRTAEKES